MDYMQLLIQIMQIKDTHYHFGGNVYLLEKYLDGNTIIQEFQVQFH
jgi:hypothetical protein